jgi:hypothetical protein
MSRYITLGADEQGQVYGLELNDDETWRRDPMGYSTSCVVISPMDSRTYEYITEDPASAKDMWQQSVASDFTEKGLEEWFDDYKYSADMLDESFVSDLLDSEDNPTVSQWGKNCLADEDNEFESFREFLEDSLIYSDEVVGVECKDDVCKWEASGCFPPKRPFVLELAPRKLLDEYYAHLKSTSEFSEV